MDSITRICAIPWARAQEIAKQWNLKGRSQWRYVYGISDLVGLSPKTLIILDDSIKDNSKLHSDIRTGIRASGLSRLQFIGNWKNWNPQEKTPDEKGRTLVGRLTELGLIGYCPVCRRPTYKDPIFFEGPGLLHFFHLDNECRVQADPANLLAFWERVAAFARSAREQAEQAMYAKPLSAGDMINLDAIPPGSIVEVKAIPYVFTPEGLKQAQEEPSMPQQRGAGRIRSPRTLMSQQRVPGWMWDEAARRSREAWDKIREEIFNKTNDALLAGAPVGKMVFVPRPEPPKPETLSPIPNRNKIRKITLKDD